MEWFRKCPSCGARLSVRLRSREWTEAEEDTERIVYDVLVPGGYNRPTQSIPLGAREAEIPIERDTYTLSYECGRCHHRWTETMTKTKSL